MSPPAIIPSSVTSPSTRIIMGDPGGLSDAFGFVGVEASLPLPPPHRGSDYSASATADPVITIKYAREIRAPGFDEIAEEISREIRPMRPNFLGFETNHRGDDAVQAFRRHGFRAFGVATTAETRDHTRMAAMDKPFTARYLRDASDIHHRLIWPPPTTAAASSSSLKASLRGIGTLRAQWKSIVAMPTPSGRTTYRAERGRHDDLFSALLLCAHVARIWALRVRGMRPSSSPLPSSSSAAIIAANGGRCR